MQAVEGAGGSSAVVRRIAAVGEPDAVPAFAQAAVAATLLPVRNLSARRS